MKVSPITKDKSLCKFLSNTNEKPIERKKFENAQFRNPRLTSEYFSANSNKIPRMRKIEKYTKNIVRISKIISFRWSPLDSYCIFLIIVHSPVTSRNELERAIGFEKNSKIYLIKIF